MNTWTCYSVSVSLRFNSWYAFSSNKKAHDFQSKRSESSITQRFLTCLLYFRDSGIYCMRFYDLLQVSQCLFDYKTHLESSTVPLVYWTEVTRGDRNVQLCVFSIYYLSLSVGPCLNETAKVKGLIHVKPLRTFLLWQR